MAGYVYVPLYVQIEVERLFTKDKMSLDMTRQECRRWRMERDRKRSSPIGRCPALIHRDDLVKATKADRAEGWGLRGKDSA